MTESLGKTLTAIEGQHKAVYGENVDFSNTVGMVANGNFSFLIENKRKQLIRQTM